MIDAFVATCSTRLSRTPLANHPPPLFIRFRGNVQHLSLRDFSSPRERATGSKTVKLIMHGRARDVLLFFSLLSPTLTSLNSPPIRSLKTAESTDCRPCLFDVPTIN